MHMTIHFDRVIMPDESFLHPEKAQNTLKSSTFQILSMLFGIHPKQLWMPTLKVVTLGFHANY